MSPAHDPTGGTWLSALEMQTTRLSDRLATVTHRGNTNGPVDAADLSAVVADFGVAVEELHATQEELRLQAEALAEAYASVEASRGRYRELFEFLPDACLVTDAEGRVRDANGAVSGLVGFARKYAHGKPVLAFVAPESAQLCATHLAALRAATDDRAHAWEMTFRPRRTGPPTVVSARVRPLRDATGAPAGFIWLLRDVTEAARTAAALRQEREERERQVRTRTAELEALARMHLEALKLETAEHTRLRAEVRRLAEAASALGGRDDAAGAALAAMSRSLLAALEGRTELP